MKKPLSALVFLIFAYLSLTAPGKGMLMGSLGELLFFNAGIDSPEKLSDGDMIRLNVDRFSDENYRGFVSVCKGAGFETKSLGGAGSVVNLSMGINDMLILLKYDRANGSAEISYSPEIEMLTFTVEPEIGDRVYFGKYPQSGADAENEPLLWRVIDKQDSKILLLTEKVIDYLPFNSKGDMFCTWENSTIRAWLNGEFLSTAFDQNELSRVMQNESSPDENPYYSTGQGRSVTDFAFLPSSKQIEEYFPNKEERRATATRYALNKNLTIFNGFAYYMTRSNASNYSTYSVVNATGGLYEVHYTYNSCGIRPALWVRTGAAPNL